MDNLYAFLKDIKKPSVNPDDRAEEIEGDVGDSVSEAYYHGFNDGKKKGRYDLAQQLLKLLKDEYG